MNSHILSGVVGAFLALAGSTAIENIKCNRIETNYLALAFEGKSVAIDRGGIELRDEASGAWCLLTANGIRVMGSDSGEGGVASLQVSSETGAVLHLVQDNALVSLKASGGQEPEASLRARFNENRSAVLAYPDQAIVGVTSNDKTAILDCQGTKVSRESGVDEARQGVFVTSTGDKYHRAGCQYLRSSMIPIDLAEARKRFAPCKVCTPGG
jgi:hypothetical protein